MHFQTIKFSHMTMIQIKEDNLPNNYLKYLQQGYNYYLLQRVPAFFSGFDMEEWLLTNKKEWCSVSFIKNNTYCEYSLAKNESLDREYFSSYEFDYYVRSNVIGDPKAKYVVGYLYNLKKYKTRVDNGKDILKSDTNQAGYYDSFIEAINKAINSDIIIGDDY